MKAWEAGLYQTIDLRPLLRDVRCPTLAVAGELDLVGGPAQASTIARSVEGAELEIIPDCGHFLALEEPDAYRRAVLRWVDALDD